MCVVAERSVIWVIMCFVPSGSQVCGGYGARASALRQRSGSARTDNAHGNSSVKPGRKPSGGEIGSENVDMSSDKEGERPSRRKSKGSCLKLI